MKKTSSPPSKDGSFAAWELNFLALIILNKLAWAIPDAVVTPLQSAADAWRAIWAVCSVKTGRTSAQVAAKNDAKDAYIALLRPFIQRYVQYNDALTDENRVSLGIKPRETHHAPVPVPTSTPVVEVSRFNNTVNIHFRQEADADGQSRRGKPAGVARMEVVYVIGEEPASRNDCNRTVSENRSPIRVTNNNPDDSGKTIYFYAHWVNAKNEGGPWSEMYSFQIP